MIDWNRTLEVLRGAVLEPEPTWQAVKARQPDWQETAMTVAGPMIVLTAILAPILGWLFGTNFMPGFGGFLTQILLVLIGGLLGLAVAGAVFGLLAGSFGGRGSFDHGFAAVTLASVPAYVGQVVGTLPWIGWLLALALSIYSLVLLYRNQPVFLDVPQDKRIAHFAVCFVLLVVIWMVISAPVAGLLMP